jgi:mutator protein MutT
MQQTTQPIRETARGVIIRNNEILLIRRTRQNAAGRIDNWLSIPGGGLEPGETPQQAVVRELQEELELNVKIDSFLAKQDVPTDESRHYYFLCSILEGEPCILEESEEYARMQDKAPNTYAVEWTKLNSSKLPNELFWAYAEAYIQFKPFVSSERREPLSLLTSGNSSASETVVRTEIVSLD